MLIFNQPDYQDWIENNSLVKDYFKNIDLSPMFICIMNSYNEVILEKWCEENCKGKWHRYVGLIFAFEDKEDVLMFKLIWG